MKCQVAVSGRLHDCRVITPLPPAQAPFAEAAEKIVVLSMVKTAKDKGAPVVLTMVFEPMR